MTHVDLWKNRMNQHEQDTDGFTVDLFAPENEQRLFDCSVVNRETLEYTLACIPHIKPKQKATLKKALIYLTAMRDRQIELHESRLERFEDEQSRLKAYLKKRQNG